MDITCPQCKETYQVDLSKPKVEKPPEVTEEKTGTRSFRFSWWWHRQPYDLRVVGLLLSLGLLYLAVNLGDSPVWTEGLKDTQRDWASLGGFLVTWLGAMALLAFLFKVFFRRRFLEWDGSRLRSWHQPLTGGVTDIPYRQVKQVYVTAKGELLCKTGAREQTSLTAGTPLAMRYLEQRIEDNLQIEDELIDGEWRASRWLEAKARPCPHCDFVPNTIQPVAEEVPLHPRVTRRNFAQGVELSWKWGEWWMVFFALWLMGWDSFCIGVVGNGVKSVFHGHVEGLLVFLIPHVWVGVFLTYGWLAYLLNTTTITCERGAVRVSCSPLPWWGWPKVYPAGSLEQIFVVVQKSQRNNQATYGLQARSVSGETVKLINYCSDGKMLRYIEQELERQLNIVNEPVSGEWDEPMS
jgi:hypothetical protein